MSAETEARFDGSRLGHTVVVAAFVLMQALAFAAVYSAGRSTLYAYFVVFSAMGAAFVLRGGRGVPRATLRFLVTQAVAVTAAYAFAVVLDQWVGLSIAGIIGHPAHYLGYVVFGTAAAALAIEESRFTVVTASVGSVLVVALGLPLFMFAARQTPSLVVDKALDPGVQRVLYLGVYGPLLAALVSLLLGVPLAHMLAEGFPGQPFVESLVDLPLVVPHSVAGIIILFGFGQGGAFPQFSVLGTMVGMVLAMVFVSAPYAVNTTREAFEAIDDQLEYASRIHGASEWETFRRVTGPLALRGMITGGVLAWARAVSEFGAVAVVAYSVKFFYPVAGQQVTAQHAPVFVYNTYLQGGLPESGAVAFLLLAVSALIFLIVRYLTNDGTPTGGVV
jgi:molybdate/tungstate transport system permease protein